MSTVGIGGSRRLGVGWLACVWVVRGRLLGPAGLTPFGGLLVLRPLDRRVEGPPFGLVQLRAILAGGAGLRRRVAGAR